MMINPQIRQIFKQYNIPEVDGMLYLFAVYYEMEVTGATFEALEPIIKQVNVSKIVERDYTTTTVKWNIPLFMGQETEWQWITDYMRLFTAVRRDRGGSLTSCVKRMKTFFAKHPEVRKDDVMAAARAYIASVDDPQYLQGADYFIQKGTGVETTSRLEQYLEIIKVKKEANNIKLM